MRIDDLYFEEINIGVDFGGSRSAHAFVCCGVARQKGAAGGGGGAERVLVALASERHTGDIDPIALYELIIGFTRFVTKKYGRVRSIYCDSSETVLIRGLRNAADGAGFSSKPAVRGARKGKILDRIRGTLSLMAQGRFFYTPDCGTLVDALTTAVWCDRRENERLDDGTCDIDTLDAFEYAWEGARL